MSRDFDGTTSDLSRTSNAIADFPFSISVWFNPDTLTGSDKYFFSAHDNPGVSLVVACVLDSGDSWKPYLALYDGSYKIAKATTGATTGAWQHGGFVAASSTSYSAYYNGGSKGTTTTAVSMTLSNMNRTALGKQSFASAGYFDGKMAHVALWSAALTDAEMEVLAAGLLPTRVRPASLVAYWSLSGKDSPEIDIVGRNDLTVTSAAASNEEPRVFRNYA